MTDIDTTAPSPESCGTCRYYLVVNETKGMCRRFPPVFSPDLDHFHWNHPPVSPAWWCGEWGANVQPNPQPSL